ncbi:MAG: hypothetical protein ACFB2Z_05125 [Maricaulaceae bacterium]
MRSQRKMAKHGVAGLLGLGAMVALCTGSAAQAPQLDHLPDAEPTRKSNAQSKPRLFSVGALAPRAPIDDPKFKAAMSGVSQTRAPVRNVSSHIRGGDPVLDAQRVQIESRYKAALGTKVRTTFTADVTEIDPANNRLDAVAAREHLVGYYGVAPLNDDLRQVDVSYEVAAPFDGPGGLQVEVAPRAAAFAGAEANGGGVGALVRFGENFSGPRRQGEPAWYVFAGADAQTVTLDPRAGFELDEVVRVEDRAVIGDLQAGLAMKVGPADLGVSYIRRRTRLTAGGLEQRRDDNFAAVSLSLRR